MTWVLWRQHRSQAAACAAALAGLAGLLLLTRTHMTAVADQIGLADCLHAHPHRCSDMASAFADRFATLQAAAVLILTIPALAGLMIGAPLVARELEHGTERLVWTQSITRRRWIVAKLAATVGGSALAAALLSRLALWWFDPLARSGVGRMRPLAFDIQGIAPIGYAAFAVALGALAGTVARRTLPAMGLTLAAYTVVRIAVEALARPHYAPTAVSRGPLQIGAHPRRIADWVLSQNITDRFGHAVTVPLSTICPSKATAAGCIAAHHLRLERVYQPAGRFWLFQGIELAIFAALAAACAALTVWWVRRQIN